MMRIKKTLPYPPAAAAAAVAETSVDPAPAAGASPAVDKAPAAGVPGAPSKMAPERLNPKRLRFDDFVNPPGQPLSKASRSAESVSAEIEAAEHMPLLVLTAHAFVPIEDPARPNTPPTPGVKDLVVAADAFVPIEDPARPNTPTTPGVKDDMHQDDMHQDDMHQDDMHVQAGWIPSSGFFIENEDMDIQPIKEPIQGHMDKEPVLKVDINKENVLAAALLWMPGLDDNIKEPFYQGRMDKEPLLKVDINKENAKDSVDNDTWLQGFDDTKGACRLMPKNYKQKPPVDPRSSSKLVRTHSTYFAHKQPPTVEFESANSKAAVGNLLNKDTPIKNTGLSPSEDEDAV
jgi:hypothetical protein